MLKNPIFPITYFFNFKLCSVKNLTTFLVDMANTELLVGPDGLVFRGKQKNQNEPKSRNSEVATGDTLTY